MRLIWSWLLVEDHRRALSFLGVATAALVSACWTLFVYLDRPVAELPPPAELTSPEPPADAADSWMRQRLVGSWHAGTRRYPPDIALEISYVLNADGTASWVGRGPRYTLLLGGTWEIRDGVMHTEITTTNMPDMVPAGFRATFPIDRLTDSEVEYVEQISGRRVVDRRIR